MKGFRYLANVATLEIAAHGCICCGRCVEVCPHGVITLDDGRAVIADLDACMECGACARNCPVDVISVQSGVGCASGLLAEWLQRWFPSSRSRGC